MKKKILLTLMLCCNISIILMAQQTVILKGKVTNSKSEPLAGATIAIMPLGKITVTNDLGEYDIKFQTTETKLSVKATNIGYAGEEKAIENVQPTVEVNFSLKSDVLALNDVVVLSSSGAKSKLNSSISVSTLRPDDIQKSAPRTTAEIFRSIPGIKAEASGGDGNTNITVRGIPISAGGSKYLQLQEDGLPILQFGDIAFATSDIFLRADNTLGKIEALRGGSASILATNSPAGIINFISKTGQVEGGSVAVSSGLDYGNFRTDFNYGSPLGNGFSYNIGGFYRVGEGPRKAGFDANNGGQLKFNVTKNFNKGYIRFYFKYLNDKAAAYMSTPFLVTGSTSHPTYKGLDGFDPMYGSLYSPYMMQDFGIGDNGERRKVSMSDGMHPISLSYGFELNYDLGNDWRIENKSRITNNHGDFVAPFPADVDATSSVLSTIAGATGWNLTGATVKYALDGTVYTGPHAMVIHTFDVQLNNFNNYLNDFKLVKKFNSGSATFGFYKSIQNINMSWVWNSYLTDIRTSGLRPLDIYDGSGNKMTQNGQFAYGVPIWGVGNTRNYDVTYDISAPYVSASWEATNKLSFDGGLRWDIGKANGTYCGGSLSQMDVNGDGIIQPIEKSVASINYANPSIVDYNYNYLSYSVGANYKLTYNTAVFARYSLGYSAKADRILFTTNALPDGSVKGVKDKIEQAELGYKGNFKNVGLFVTGFYARVNENGGYEATTQKIIENHYESYGVELELAARISKEFDIHGGATYTKARITQGANKDNLPRRQSPFIYNFMPTYTHGNLSIGVSAVGTSYSYSQDDNYLKFKGYILINPFVSYKFNKMISLSVNGNNVFNSLGITESEADADAPSNSLNAIVRARSVTGRTISAMLGINF